MFSFREKSRHGLRKTKTVRTDNKETKGIPKENKERNKKTKYNVARKNNEKPYKKIKNTKVK